MREWIKVGMIPNDQEFIKELVSPSYGFNNRDEIQLERKSDMKRRGIKSPDCGDALALTFSYLVMGNSSAGRAGGSREAEVEFEYDPFKEVA